MAEKIVKDSQGLAKELVNDCISRKAAIDAFDGVKVDEENCTEYDIGYNDGIDFAVSRLSVLPSAQPERKRGKWKPYRCDMYKCSKCGYIYTELTDRHKCGANYCPNCGEYMGEWMMKDMIYKQEAIDALNKLDVSDGVGISSVACDLQKEAIHSIENLPSAQPERKRGCWIPHEDEDGEHYGDKCSECGEWYVMPYGKTNFCPNCGADMRGETDE